MKRETVQVEMALEAALNHAHQFPVPIEMTFVEDQEDRCQILRQQLFPYRPAISRSNNVRNANCVCGDCRTVITQMMDDAAARHEKFGPALVFLDQFGYSSVPMDLIKRILSEPRCEALTFLFWRDLDRFITDPNKHAGITLAFGCADWQQAIQLHPDKQATFMLNMYVECLTRRGGAKYVWPFAMFDQNRRLLAWLFFCTNALRGLEEMKKAMWKVDSTGGFTFSDKEGFGQLTMLGSYSDDDLAADLQRHLTGRTMSIGEVKEWVLVDTPAYRFKPALGALERRNALRAIKAPSTRHSGQFPDEDMMVEFVAAMPTSLFD